MQWRVHELDKRLRDMTMGWEMKLLMGLNWLVEKMEDEEGTWRQFGWLPSTYQLQLASDSQPITRHYYLPYYCGATRQYFTKRYDVLGDKYGITFSLGIYIQLSTL